MPLNGWIGPKIRARERHVFTLLAINQRFRRESKEKGPYRCLTLARAMWRLKR